ncbi:hypothetical protein N7468_008959 [Penicillium chermesinum]|uniref:Uncharacterized protein n=1 Tax=Penicillium chermesinum TaxID=63820 RepID=A0A9W9TFN3_9EURO|nr:uncharacterized protein N7468_008959 [Penicillium chermesinum]KAJ5219755.1 hypothetical protein N7468_008959 [Penicillium chermesinum]KAJ6153748.1 hypothetical protein N7470_006707 [Penicillium chermesinum]
MAPVHSFFRLFTLVLAFPLLAIASPWIITEDFRAVTITYGTDDYYFEDEPTAITSFQSISPTVTSVPEALSTITSVDEYDSVTVIQHLYPSSVGTAVVDPDDDYYDSYGNDYSSSLEHTTVYVVPITLTAPSVCKSQWTTTTDAVLYVPTEVAAGLPHTAVSTSLVTDDSRPFQPVTYTYEYVSVAPSQIPTASMSSLREDEYSSMYDMGYCSYDYGSYYCQEGDEDCVGNNGDDGSSSSSTGSGYNGYDGYNGNDDGDYGDDYDGHSWYFDPYWIGISPFALTMILLFGWIGVWLIAGFIEAWLRFRRLMLGWQTRRGLPVCWAFTVLPISLLLLFFFRKGYRARNLADAAVLREKWSDMGFGTKLKLFFLWGFRFKYPDMLGTEPPLVKSSKMPRDDPHAPRNAPRSGLLAAAQPAPEMTGAGHQRGMMADPEFGEAGPSLRSGAVSPVSSVPPSPAADGAPAFGPVAASDPAHHGTAATGSATVRGDDEIGRAQ